VRDFPGLDGLGGFAEYAHPMNEKLRAAFGLKWNNLQGYPRTNEVKEYTRAVAMDLYKSFDYVFLAGGMIGIRI
jgi:hypothetical protein